jgi:hypothetical protein
MCTAEEQFLMKTLEFWQKRTERKLTLEDAREIIENACSFFETLASTSETTDATLGRDVAS